MENTADYRSGDFRFLSWLAQNLLLYFSHFKLVFGLVLATFPMTMYVVIDTLYLSREHIELENLRGEHTRVLEETKKEKVTFCVSVPYVFKSAS